MTDQQTASPAQALPSPAALEALNTDIGGVLESMEQVSDYLERVVHAVRRHVKGCDEVGVTILSAGRPHTAAYTTVQTLEIDAVQYALDDGPCLDAARRRRENRVDDLVVDDGRWPEFAKECRDDGMRSLRETCIKETYALNMLPVIDSYLALERAEFGDVDEAVRRWATIVDEMESDGRLSNIDIPLMFMVEQLLELGECDRAEHELERLESLAADREWDSRAIGALRLRVLLTRARGDETEYRELRERYRAMADRLGFEAHMAWAQQMV